MISNFLKLSHKEVRGFSSLFIVSVLALLLIFFPKILIRHHATINPADIKQLDSLVAILNKVELSSKSHEVFNFDPNKTSLDSLMLLGFSQKIAQRIQNYISKGGHFYKKEDVKKIYGISDQLVLDLYPYMMLPDSGRIATKRIIEKFDLNNASEIQLKKVQMIGAVLAARIVKYRSLLGGFISKDQLDEVYGLSDEAKDYLKSSTFIGTKFSPQKISINRAQEDVLSKHPYISYELAEDIVRFRHINSKIESKKVLVNFKSIDKSNFKKLILYLDFQ